MQPIGKLEREGSRAGILDLSEFPIVRFDNDRLGSPAGVAAWIREMERLLERSRPFVVVSLGLGEPALRADRRVLSAWFRARIESRRPIWKGMVVVEPDAAARRRMEALAGRLLRSLPFPLCIAASPAAAHAAARALLAGGSRA